MAFDLGGIGSTLFSWMSSFIFWGILLLIFIVITIGTLVIRKKRKLKFPVIEQTDLGAGKVGLQYHKGGWFKSKSMLFGLVDYAGEDVFKLKDGRQVQDASSSDYHDIFGTRGLIVQRKGDDPKILLPISKVKLDKESKESLNAIAPADFRDASVKIVERSEKETLSKLEKIMPWIGLITVGIIIFICIILAIQYSKWSVAEAKDLVIQVAKQCPSVSSLASTAP